MGFPNLFIKYTLIKTRINLETIFPKIGKQRNNFFNLVMKTLYSELRN